MHTFTEKHQRILALPTQLKKSSREKISFSKFGLTITRRYQKFVDRDKAKIGQTIVYFLFNELFVIEFLSYNLFRYNKNDISVYFEKKRLISRFRAFIFMKWWWSENTNFSNYVIKIHFLVIISKNKFVFCQKIRLLVMFSRKNEVYHTDPRRGNL